MKKIYKSVLFTIIAAAGFTACSDYEAPDITTESAISITGYETSFPASASTGSITFEAKGPVTVTTNNQWITASVDGNRIDIAVDQNNAFSGRSGSITVKCGNATDNISIIQSGIISNMMTSAQSTLILTHGHRLIKPMQHSPYL